MKKTRIQKGINSIIESIKITLEITDNCLKPYEYIKKQLDIIQSIEKENKIDTGLDYEMVLDDTLRSCITKIEDTKNIEKIEMQFNSLLNNLKEWESEDTNKESEQTEQYINILTTIKDSFDPSTIEELQSQLLDMIKRLEDVEV